MDPFWLQLILKMAASATVVVIATVAAEKAGPFWGAMIASLPVSAGPIYILLALEHDAAFLARCAVGSMAATAATAVYMLALAMVSPRLPVWAAIPAALLIWLTTTVGIRFLEWDIVSATALNVGAMIVCMAVTVDERRWASPRSSARQWYDLPLRAMLVATLVALVSTFSRALGAEATGYAAVFPIVMTSLALIIQLRQGGRAVATIMANSFLPMIGFAFALIALHVVAPLAGSAWGLVAGLSGSILWSIVLAVWRLAIAPRMAASSATPAVSRTKRRDRR